MVHILIVEDNPADQFLHEITLKKSNQDLKISKVFDGQEALEYLENADSVPDIILLDINMPRVNGHEFLEEHTKKHTSDIPVVVMLTSSDQRLDKEKAMQYMCVKDYLIKPLKDEDIVSLFNAVEAVLGKKGS